MSRAGHSSYATTRRYVDLAGERFREEAERLERRLWGQSSSRRSEPSQVAAAPVAVAPTQVGQVPQHAGATSDHRSRNGSSR